MGSARAHEAARMRLVGSLEHGDRPLAARMGHPAETRAQRVPKTRFRARRDRRDARQGAAKTRRASGRRRRMRPAGACRVFLSPRETERLRLAASPARLVLRARFPRRGAARRPQPGSIRAARSRRRGLHAFAPRGGASPESCEPGDCRQRQQRLARWRRRGGGRPSACGSIRQRGKSVPAAEPRSDAAETEPRLARLARNVHVLLTRASGGGQASSCRFCPLFSDFVRRVSVGRPEKARRSLSSWIAK